MFSDKETRVVEACLLVAVPLSIVLAAVFAWLIPF